MMDMVPGAPPVYAWTEEQRRQAGFEPGGPRPRTRAKSDLGSIAIGLVCGLPLAYVVLRLLFGGLS